MKQLFGLLLFHIFTNHFTNVNSETQTNHDREPVFTSPIKNISVSVGREALLSCYVENLDDYKVGWMRQADQTVLALQGRVVTHNSRYSVIAEEMKVWRLKISNIRESDRGCYMCQINTTPLKKQIGCIDVHLPPDILDAESSKDITVNEGHNASLYCLASGNPRPRIFWRRDDGSPIIMKVNNKTRRLDTFEGDLMSLAYVDRRNMGAYLCIAKNDVPPAVSKRLFLNVNFAPNVTILNEKMVHVLEGTHVEILCDIEASPRPVSYWIKEPLRKSYMSSQEDPRQNVLQEGDKYTISEIYESHYKATLRMRISNFSESDVGIYTCIASNIMGRDNGTIRLYEIKIPTTTTEKPTTTTTVRTTTRRTTKATTTTTSTTVLTTEVSSSTEQLPYEYVTINPDLNDIAGDPYGNRPQLNVAYSTSHATDTKVHHQMKMIMVMLVMPFIKLLLMFR